MLPLVSVVITTRNSASTLVQLLESIKQQSYKKREIVIVDNKSSDNTKEIARRYTQKVYNKGPERSAQRNFGASRAKGKYLLFLDSDMILANGVLMQCVDRAEKDKTIGGLVIPERSFGEGIWAKAKALERRINEGEDFFEAARFFPKKVFKEMGGYDLSMTGPEDWELPRRIRDRYKIGRVRAYIRHNEGNLTLENLIKKKYYYGFSAHKYLKKRNLPIVSKNTVYFLRPAFYRKWQLLLESPVISLAMIFMLACELFAGGLGFMVGKMGEAFKR